MSGEELDSDDGNFSFCHVQLISVITGEVEEGLLEEGMNS